MIRLNQVHKYYGEASQQVHVLRGINLAIENGEMVSIMGSSGSGKSTLLNVLGILDSYSAGAYYLDNKLIEKLSEKQAAYLRNRHLGFVFQSFNLLPFKTAQENAALPLFYQKVGKKERQKRAEEELEKVGLAERMHHLPAELSGGQKQRVALARALITNPKVILADEPTGALDSQTSQNVMQIFKDIHAAGKTVVIVTHEEEVAKQTQRTIYLKDGLIV